MVKESRGVEKKKESFGRRKMFCFFNKTVEAFFRSHLCSQLSEQLRWIIFTAVPIATVQQELNFIRRSFEIKYREMHLDFLKVLSYNTDAVFISTFNDEDLEIASFKTA